MHGLLESQGRPRVVDEAEFGRSRRRKLRLGRCGNKFGKPFVLTVDINRPENCQAAKTSRSNATITEHTVYNKNGAAFVMLEYGTAGLRVFDVRNGDEPKEVAYYNDGKGHVHSGVFHYDDARGVMIASGRQAAHVLMLEPQVIDALGLPKPIDPKYPYK